MLYNARLVEHFYVVVFRNEFYKLNNTGARMLDYNLSYDINILRTCVFSVDIFDTYTCMRMLL